MTDSCFSNLDLPQAQLDNLKSLGYHNMTPIQAQSLPLALAGEDVIAKAKTGSGKTASFAIGMLHKIRPRLFSGGGRLSIQGLVLCPTRELSTQVAKEIRRLARYQQNIKVVTLCGGQSIGPQIGSLEHGAHIVVGTPGRIKDHLRKGTLDLERVETLVLDEADRMLDMGFYEDIERIIVETPVQRQTLLFSATYPEGITALSAQFQQQPVEVTVESLHSHSQIAQVFYGVSSHREKDAALLQLVGHYRPSSAVVFCNTKQLCDQVSAALRAAGHSAQALHGDMEQRERDQVLVQFANQSCAFLVATDVAARGLDIDDLPMVINYDLSRDDKVYVHRIGRTGRAGKEGIAVSLYANSEGYKLEALEELLEQPLDKQPLSALDSANAAAPELPPMVTLCIAGGRKDKVRPGDILGALTGDAGIPGKAVGKIDIFDFVAYVAVERDLADKALGRLLNGKIKGRKFKLRRLD